jgi:Tol biopolymer transport system component
VPAFVRIGLKLAVVACLSSACAASPGSPQPSPSPSRSATLGATSARPLSSAGNTPDATARLDLTGRILFSRAGGRFGDGTVFSASADGSNERQLTAACCPRWSWDGTRILAAALDGDGRRITTQILDQNGTVVSKVPLPSGTLNLGPGTWAPDGKRILFDGFGDAKDEGLYVGNVAGGGLVRLTHTRGQTVDFTPDGRRVIYFEPVPGFGSGGNQDEPNGSLFVINGDGVGGSTLITPTDMQIGNLGGYTARLSSDGAWLVFAAEQGSAYGPRAIWKVKVDGSSLTKVFEPADEGVILSPTWSPDGNFIMFGLDPPGTLSADNPSNSLVVIRADGSGLTTVVSTQDFKVGPDWTR